VLGDGSDALTLPDTYNGLGFKNLIYMVVEILDLHARWLADKEKRSPLHLIFIEEPEAHLHAQLQQVFIRNVLDLMKEEGEDESAFHSQTVVTTHSPHILYERGFQPIRYFRRQNIGGEQTTDVLNLSTFYSQNLNDRDFLQRYLKLTHCDLFFADAAILVEGNVERLLLPVMIEKEAVFLRSACLSILEVGGAFGHRFKSLIEFLGLVALVITDIDSVALVAGATENEDEDTEFEVPNTESGQAPVKRTGKTCLPSAAGALTSNQTLIQWLPKSRRSQNCSILMMPPRYRKRREATASKYASRIKFLPMLLGAGRWRAYAAEHSKKRSASKNAEWCQAQPQRHIGLKLQTNPESPADLASALHKRVTGRSFDKTKFALGVLTELPANWRVPLYIKQGLQWLVDEVNLELPAPQPAIELAPAIVVPAEAAE